jgi:hypothetical protein
VNLARHLRWKEPVDQSDRVQEGRVEILGRALITLDVRVEASECSLVIWRLFIVLVQIRTAWLGPSSAEKVGLRPEVDPQALRPGCSCCPETDLHAERFVVTRVGQRNDFGPAETRQLRDRSQTGHSAFRER